MILTFRPIKVWPPDWNREQLDRQHSPFSSTYADTLQLLDRELDQLRATGATLQVDATERDCRLDGQLRADAKVRHPGVILTIETKRHGPLTYATDRFGEGGWGSTRRPAWQENLRGIALGLEALRKIERYGIANRGQQYAGYRELGAGIIAPPVAMTIEDAARFLVEHGEWGGTPATVDEILTATPEVVRAYFREAAKRLHPDTGGDADLFRRLNDARELLEALR